MCYLPFATLAPPAAEAARALSKEGGFGGFGRGTTPAAEAAPPSPEGGFLDWTKVTMEAYSVNLVQTKKAPFRRRGCARRR
ncbi:MAG: hypothetical protein LBM98_04390, partial [Oscillospiraceae bacterium]|nr:hypothetical protein [Oscillospiraceae bacterium]